MGGHNSPGKAHTQMTNEQKATDKRTQVYPGEGPVIGDATTVATGRVPGTVSTETRVPVALATGTFREPPTSEEIGDGFWGVSSFSAQGQDSSGAQHSQDAPTDVQGSAKDAAGNI